MKNKIIVGALSGLLLLGGAIAVGASKNDTRPDDSVHLEDKTISSNVKGMEQTQSEVKVEVDDSNSSSAATTTKLITAEKAAEIAIKEVNGTVEEIEKELEHGRMEYKVELNTSTGEAEVRIDAETGKVVRVEHDDDDKDDSRDDDTKTDDGAHQNRHSGDDDTKADDGAHQNRHSGDDDDDKDDDGAHQNRHSGDDDDKDDDDDDN
jgi:uncharacterized membrane protein YkoI